MPQEVRVRATRFLKSVREDDHSHVVPSAGRKVSVFVSCTSELHSGRGQPGIVYRRWAKGVREPFPESVDWFLPFERPSFVWQ